MKTIESNTDIKKCFKEIKAHLSRNIETVKGKKEAETILVISREAYDLKRSNLSYNKRMGFSLQCNSSSKTWLFRVA